MGIPYSREIHQAFSQVTPLVACGFRVLETTRDISIIVACIQVLTCLLLGLNLLALLGLLISVNPDMELERQELVTPVMRWLTAGFRYPEDRKFIKTLLVTIVGGMCLGAWAGFYSMQEPASSASEERVIEEVSSEEVEGTGAL